MAAQAAVTVVVQAVAIAEAPGVVIAVVRHGVPAAPAVAIVIGEATAATGAALAVLDSHGRTSPLRTCAVT